MDTAEYVILIIMGTLIIEFLLGVSWIVYTESQLRIFHHALCDFKRDINLRLSSSVTDRTEHPAYQKILRIGPRAVPWILLELQKENDHWYYALRKLTGENPVPERHRGNMLQMRWYWLRWGTRQGYEGLDHNLSVTQRGVASDYKDEYRRLENE